MISDRDCAAMCLTLYGDTSVPLILWDHIDLGNGPDGICWAHKRLSDIDVIVLRGSVTLLDWRRDFDAWASPDHGDALGPVHPGFFAGMRDVWTQKIKPLLDGRPVVVTGHSLGAARAAILVGLMVVDNVVPAKRVVFGEPKPGFQKLADLIRRVPQTSYRNGDARWHDLVCDVPYTLGDQAYVHPVPLTLVSGAPTPAITAKLGVFSWHHLPLYYAALAKQDAAHAA